MTNQLIDIPAFHATSPALGLSERYQFYSTKELISPLLNDGWEVTQATQVRAKHYNPHGKHLVRLTHPRLKLGEDRLEAVIRNSHDGRSKLEIMLGAWRLICSNGLILGITFADVAITHRKAFDLVQARAQELIEHGPEVATVFDAWRCQGTTEDQRHAFAVSAALLRWNRSKAPVDPEELLTVRRDEDRFNDVWTVYNRVQENVIQGGVTHQDGRRTTRGIRAIDESLRINKGLWGLSEQLYRDASGVALAS